MLPFGIGYHLPTVSRGKTMRGALRVYLVRTRNLIRMSRIVLRPGRQREWAPLPGAGMGFGYLPSFWRRQADAHQLSVEIVSSRYYEYRYHVMLRKPGFDG